MTPYLFFCHLPKKTHIQYDKENVKFNRTCYVNYKIILLNTILIKYYKQDANMHYFII